jgi:hypothetical protein
MSDTDIARGPLSLDGKLARYPLEPRVKQEAALGDVT